jgi:Na+-transporting methylmalonyl-CoA/oxaloacetate decarboxylase gamma subunit
MINEWFQNFIRSGTNFQKSIFLMVSGIVFVFLVQVIFYLFVKLWPKGKDEEQ